MQSTHAVERAERAGRGARSLSKIYDRAYYDRWYRSARASVTPALTRRKARFALAAAEHLLGRNVRSVLDVGCGEGLWRAPLRRARPGLTYTGVDGSEYAVARFGRRRNIRHGTLADLHRLRLQSGYDLVVCADMLQYVPNAEVHAGLHALAERTHGVAYIEAFVPEDDMTGDRLEWHHRSASWYRKAFRDAGFIAVGLHCYIMPSMLPLTNALERLE